MTSRKYYEKQVALSMKNGRTPAWDGDCLWFDGVLLGTVGHTVGKYGSSTGIFQKMKYTDVDGFVASLTVKDIAEEIQRRMEYGTK